jgi:hypothetical protein
MKITDTTGRLPRRRETAELPRWCLAQTGGNVNPRLARLTRTALRPVAGQKHTKAQPPRHAKRLSFKAIGMLGRNTAITNGKTSG